MAYLSVEGVSYLSGGRVVLDNLSLSVERGETLVLLGRSGSGKTTALRLIDALLRPTSGAIYRAGENIAQVDPIALRRKTGYVIQELGLLPHLTIEQNVALVPRLLAWPEARQKQRAEDLLNQVGLPAKEFAHRKPQQLSGGQRQRVAVARALAAEPDLLLFDEPFGALDPITRRDMQRQLKALTARYNVALVFVTHDVAEALELATRIGVLSNGKLECLVSPQEFMQAQTPLARAFVDSLPSPVLARGEAV